MDYTFQFVDIKGSLFKGEGSTTGDGRMQHE